MFRTVNGQVAGVKGQGREQPEMKLESWQRARSQALTDHRKDLGFTLVRQEAFVGLDIICFVF